MEVLPVSGEGIYFISSDSLSPGDAAISVGLLSENGELLWLSQSATVRKDATGGVICPGRDGGILTAIGFGTGYTDILITRWSRAGDVLNADTVSLMCYDSPKYLFQHNDGYVLVWDSWSRERGLHLASLDENGNVIETVFAVETMHPAGTALSADGSSFTVAVSPVVADGNPALTHYSEVNDELWSYRLPPEIQDFADFVIDISLKDSGELVALWMTFASRGDISLSCMTVHGAGGELQEYYSTPLVEFADISFVELSEGAGIILMGRSGEDSTFWIARTDLQGQLIQKLVVNRYFSPSDINFLSDGGFLVTGMESGREDGYIMLMISSAGKVLWTFPAADSS